MTTKYTYIIVLISNQYTDWVYCNHIYISHVELFCKTLYFNFYFYFWVATTKYILLKVPQLIV